MQQPKGVKVASWPATKRKEPSRHVINCTLSHWPLGCLTLQIWDGQGQGLYKICHWPLIHYICLHPAADFHEAEQKTPMTCGQQEPCQMWKCRAAVTQHKETALSQLIVSISYGRAIAWDAPGVISGPAPIWHALTSLWIGVKACAELLELHNCQS